MHAGLSACSHSALSRQHPLEAAVLLPTATVHGVMFELRVATVMLRLADSYRACRSRLSSPARLWSLMNELEKAVTVTMPTV